MYITWRRFLEKIEETYDTYVDYEDEFFNCPDCGEPIYEDHFFSSYKPKGKKVCPICEFEIEI